MILRLEEWYWKSDLNQDGDAGQVAEVGIAMGARVAERARGAHKASRHPFPTHFLFATTTQIILAIVA